MSYDLDLSIKIDFADKPKDEGLRVPSVGRYVQILHDWVVYDGVTRQIAQGNPLYPVPAVVNKNWGILTKYNDVVYDYVPMPDEWQWFLWDLFNWGSGYKLPIGRIESFYTKTTNSGIWANTTKGSLTSVYVTMIEKSRSHSDSYPPEVGARDVVTRRNLLNPRNYEWLCRPTTGQLGKIKADLGSEWELETLDITKPPPPVEGLAQHLFGWATEITTVKLPDSRYVVSDYAFIDQALKVVNPDSPRTGTPIPFISKGGSIRIKKSVCGLLENGASWSPYVPEKY